MAERLRLWLERAERGYHLRDAATGESGLRVLIALAPDRSSELVSSRWEHALAGLDSPLMELGRPSGSPDAAVTDPPYRIVSERLVIRCWEPPDAPLLKDAIDSSLEHLQPWMPWAQTEPQLLSEKVALCASIPRKLGFEEEGTLRRRLPPHEDGVPRDVTIFALFREVFGSSPASSADLEAYDAGGNRVL